MAFNEENFLNPKYGYSYEDLYDPFRLKSLANDFFNYFESADKLNFDKFIHYKNSKGEGLSNLEISNVLIEASYKLSDFLVDLFQLGKEQSEFIAEVNYEKDVLNFKKDFVQKRVLKKFKKENLSEINREEIDSFVKKLQQLAFDEYDFENDEEKYTAKFILELAELEKNYKWFYEGDKFAPENFTIPADIKDTAELILLKLRSQNLLKDNNTSDELTDLNDLKFILENIEKWIFLKKHFDIKCKNWVSFSETHKLNFDNLVEFEKKENNFSELIQSPEDRLKPRDGFKLSDKRMNKREVLNQVDYCMYCHDRDKDSCSKGLTDRFGTKKSNPLGIELVGCPLNEKISEMHLVRKNGFPIASLALVIIDNPNLPGTGHRICNDCMKSCIFQTQEPVDIPQIETNVLTEIFKLPYGYEIYSLLTRWNPLNIKRQYALPYNGKNVMVAGMGPAGYTLSHYLLNEGFGVIGIDGLKIEKVHQKYTGVKNENGFVKFPNPVKYFHDEIEEELDKRILQGFGGVAEYGITVRWDKNFLTAIYINLARRENFRIYDGVRFGGTITIDDAWELGFDHIAIATGAGKPTVIKMKNNLIRGIRKASDFLMALQLTGASKDNNLANLQIQLPVVVIGGGLTAIDTATEALAYYPVQVLKVLNKYEKIVKETNENDFWKMYNEEETEIMKTFIEHAKDIKRETENSIKENRKANLLPLLKKWGGSTIVYRKKMTDSPAYRLNHEEIMHGLSEGISFAELLSPVEAVKNKYGAVDKIIFKKQNSAVETDELVTFEAKSVMVAAGTSPNIIYEKEFPGTFRVDETKYSFKPYSVSKDDKGNFLMLPSESGDGAFFTSYQKNKKLISYYGDNHPKYAGNVVKAMASAKDGYEKVTELFTDEISDIKNDPDSVKKREDSFKNLVSKLDRALIAKVEDVIRLTPSIIEVIVKSPFAAQKFHPGQFYRLQNYETAAKHRNGTVLTMEGLAMTGAWVDKEKGLLSMIAMEIGASSKMMADLKKGEIVVIMGPTGTPTEIPKNETVLLAGGGLGNAVLFSIGDALKKNGNRVVYFAGYKDSKDVYKMDDLEAGADQVIWSNDKGELITPRRKQDLTFNGNILESMKAYNDNILGNKIFDFKDVNRIIAIGSDGMMRAVKDSRYSIFKNDFREHVAIGSINSPMQCMMKEICGQCLQKHIDSETGKETFVFSCSNQDQLLDEVDFNNLNERLKANSVLEKLANVYLTSLISEKTG